MSESGLLLLSAQSKVELSQEEFYQEIKIRTLEGEKRVGELRENRRTNLSKLRIMANRLLIEVLVLQICNFLLLVVIVSTKG